MASPETSSGQVAGYTLVEALLAVAILALMAALVLGTGRQQLAAGRVEAAARRLGSELERSRQQAERSGTPLLRALEGPGGLVEEIRSGDASLELHHNLPAQLRFTANGLVIDGGTVVISSPGTTLRRCLVMALPLGFTRVGRYGADPGAGLSSSLCRPDPTL
ncbi:MULTISPECIES: hypothetical protein [Aphanothece]|uniref:hypothetical protein n=1 Tax=Aphanothece TaxID=1121 RepID=UPI003984AB44